MKILILADGPGWIVDRITDIMVQKIEFEFTKKYYTEIKPEELLELSKDFDLIHYQNYELDRFGFIEILDKLHCPILLSIRSHRYMSHTNEKNHKQILKKIKYFHVIDKTLLNKFPKSVYIPDAIDTQEFAPEHEFTVGFAGKPGDYYEGFGSDYKGYYLIEEACKQLGVRFKPAKGDVPHDKMKDYLKSIDLLAAASINEGFGASVVEAMAMNIPVISTNVGIMRHLNIVKVERNVESIKNAILKFYTRPQILEYNWDNICNQFKNLYQNVVSDYKNPKVNRLRQLFS